ncbi:MAG: chromosome segregation protein SMC [Anaerolineaceae bacterium]|jgi:chromosome segregation protein
MTSKLASLDLHGYKTFAKQTTLAFPARITAVVGPNGSGKSNVADAIRWVLGEQSYTLLRAKRTEDMIYSGSESRSRSGMASVSITFNNESSWLPIDYFEVVLTRRAYRDGQNEYLINNQRVRLKDFHALLAKTGLSDRTYTIIGQGLVDVALSIKPDERRKLFEEAAGIGLYQSRKEEALKRLDATQRNLERASDIMAEIKPRLRSLEKQAAKVGEYKLIQENLQRNLRDWYGFHWFGAQSEMEKLREQTRHAEGDAQSTGQTYHQKQTELQVLKERLQEQRIIVNGIHEKLRDLHEQAQTKNQEVAVLESQKTNLRSVRAQLDMDLQSLDETVKSGTTTINDLLLQQDRYKEELEKLRQKKIQSDESLIATKELAQKTEKEKSEIQNQLIAYEKEQISIDSRELESRERLEGILQANKNNQNRLENLGKEIKQSSVRLETVKRTINDIEERTHYLEEQKNQIIKKINETKAHIERNLHSINKLTIEISRQKNKKDLLVQSAAGHSGFSEGAKNVLKKTKSDGNTVITDLATKMDIPEKYETAIAAALGKAVDLLVLQHGRIDSDLLDRVRSESNDRFALMALEDLPATKDSKKSEKEKGILGWATEFVHDSKGLNKVVQQLLSSFLIVEDPATALHMRNKTSEINIVTLDGEVYYANGMVVIGKDIPSGKVSYQRLIKELDFEMKSLNMELDKKTQIGNSLQKEYDSTNQSLNRIETDLRLNQTHMTNSIRKRNEVQLELDKLNNQKQWLENQIAEGKKQAAEIKSNQEKTKKDAEVISLKISELQKQNNALKSSYDSELLTELEIINQNLEMEYRVSRLNLTNIENVLFSSGRRQQEDTTRLKEYQQRYSLTEENLRQLDLQLEALRNNLVDLNEQMDQLKKEELDPKGCSLTELENSVEKMMAEEVELQRNVSQKERHVTSVQLEMARQQEKIESLKRRIDDDFGLIELEYRTAYESSKSTPLPFPDLVIESLPETIELPKGIDEDIREQKAQIRRIGIVNLEAEHEYIEVKDRYNSLTQQTADLNAAISDIQRIVKELDEIMRKEFLETFKAVNEEFSKMFTRLFNGGSAQLVLSDENSPIEGGIDIEARLPGRREQGLVLLSGGERSLTAVALIFSLLKISPTPICVLDEVDAMLDESNVGRFIDLLKELSNETQFLLITHNRNTVQAADVIYGVTMGKDSTSQVISLKLDEVAEEYIR